VDIVIRHPNLEDGAAMWRFVKESTLADNSPYMYLLMCGQFPHTCCVVEEDGEMVGFTVGFTLPDRTDTLFIWQVGTKESMRGRGLARRQIEWLVRQNADQVRYVEATVSTGNPASQALFRSFARHADAPCKESEYIGPELFPTPETESEILFEIGPLPHAST